MPRVLLNCGLNNCNSLFTQLQVAVTFNALQMYNGMCEELYAVWLEKPYMCNVITGLFSVQVVNFQ